MLAIGSILLLVGVLALLGGGLQKYRAGRIAKTPFLKTGEVGARASSLPKQAVSAEGTVVTQRVVTAPISGAECLFYKYKVVAQWKSGEESKSLLVEDGSEGATFGIDDGTGLVVINPGKGGDFELKSTFKKTAGRSLTSVATGGPIPFGEHGFSVATGQRIQGIKIPDNAKYEVEEQCLPLTPRLYANGRYLEDGRIGAHKLASLMLSSKGRSELLAGSTTWAKRLLIGGGVASAAGAVLVTIAQISGGA
jgi:hypothetical protein